MHSKSYANFMIRDRKMQDLVSKNNEPITPYIERVRQLYEKEGVSSVMVLGGVGDYFEVADTLIQMVRYEPFDVTVAAKRIAHESPEKRRQEHQVTPGPAGIRVLQTDSIDPLNEYRKQSVYATELYRIHFGTTTIDLTDVEQIIDLSQTKAIAQAILYLGNRCGQYGCDPIDIAGGLRIVEQSPLAYRVADSKKTADVSCCSRNHSH